ncbi:hypothetical protein JVU11DRAFT_6935 [Chiua virens]|nr:hypothetical protein JVU11DRAFT_6935 [Chiua virens]
MTHQEKIGRPWNLARQMNDATKTTPACHSHQADAGPSHASYEPTGTGSDSLLKDIELIDVDQPIKPTRRDRSLDINQFFSAPYETDGKKHRDCLICSKLHKKSVHIINEVTTLRCHMEACHRVRFE